MPSGYIQYKGSDICIDLECKCGWDDHFDGAFLFGFTCPKCGISYLLQDIIEFIETPKTQENEWKFRDVPELLA